AARPRRASRAPCPCAWPHARPHPGRAARAGDARPATSQPACATDRAARPRRDRPRGRRPHAEAGCAPGDADRAALAKRRPAIEGGVALLDDFHDGIWFVRLSRLTDPGLTLPTIAEALGLKEQGSQPIAETLRANLASKRLLLVLDNFEHLTAAA